jgi:ubiquinone/menaquinone biosynthesis C-methylase UbiE
MHGKLPQGDRTPEGFTVYKPSWKERFKKPLRALFYPLLTSWRNRQLEKSYGLNGLLGLDKTFMGQRGNDYESHRRRVDRFLSIKGKELLIAGCGTGKDMESWLTHAPKRIVGVDFFDYTRAWEAGKAHFRRLAPNMEIAFRQEDLTDLEGLEAGSFDIIASDAVFEHLQDFDDAISQMARLLKQGGLIYATFGPLWHCWGGDHLGGRKGLVNGYNHLTMEKEAYLAYLEGLGDFSHHEEDGRTWVYNDLFSYLKPAQYLEKLEAAGFEKLYASAILEERAFLFKERQPEKFAELEMQFGFENIVITGMTIIYRKR